MSEEGHSLLVVYEMTPVEQWRFNVFAGAGFDPESAQRLALSSADTRQVVRAVDRGCSLELALEIFS